MGCAEDEDEDEGEAGGCVWPWQRDARLATVLELVFWWLAGASLARAGATCRAWRGAARAARAWRRLLAARSPARPDGALRALAQLYGGACPWRSLYLAAAAPWRVVARVAPAGPLASPPPRSAPPGTAWRSPPTPRRHRVARARRRLAAGGRRLGGAAGLERRDAGRVGRRAGAPRLLLAGACAGASRGALAAPGGRRAPARPRGRRRAGAAPAADRARAAGRVARRAGGAGAWRGRGRRGGRLARAARAGGSGGCWAGGASFLSLELTRLSAPPHAPHFATDVWLNAAEQVSADRSPAPRRVESCGRVLTETHCEFAGVAERVLRVYNEELALVTQVVCVETPLDARAAQEWAEAEAEAAADAELDEEDVRPRGAPGGPLDEQPPGEPYYRATQQVGDAGGAMGEGGAGCRVRLVVLACGARLLALALAGGAPPPLRARTALAERVAARARQRREVSPFNTFDAAFTTRYALQRKLARTENAR
ncbi:hypothetical protein MSG28_001869 [Choristoneura fumiferana]|uniref:Uncharacterized protein n=1 Tax=Choristoneura fumiferana TaxID=7141 RepID=A0ACC0JT23_CHOFU|nr:hypothetical protein MSG28_001869 [Choristoneura fumiferana]